MPASKNAVSSLSPGSNGLFGGGASTHSGGKHVMASTSHGAGRLAGPGSASQSGRQISVSAPNGGKWQHGMGASQGSSARQQHATGNGFGVKEEAVDVKLESPTSDYGEESGDASEAGDLCLNGEQQTQMSSSVKSYHTAPPNGGQLATSKPPYSFSCLIFMAIEDSEEKALPVKSIYAWVVHHFPYFRTAPTGWKNSVRHNLSLNKCFRKVDKSPNLGKGSLWMVDPAHRPTLLQSLSKVPFHSCGGLDKVYMLSTRHGGAKNSVPPSGLGHQSPQQQQRTSVSQPNSTNSLKDQTYHQPIKHAQLLNEANGGDWSTPSKDDQLPHSAANCSSSQASHYLPLQHTVSSQYSSVANSSSSSASQVGGTSSSASSVKKEPLREDSLQYSSSVSVSSSTASVIDSIPNRGGNAPDPALFPYLARRLGGGAAAVLPDVRGLEGVGLEDVDAANAMLALKHGPQRLVHHILGGVSLATTDPGSVSVAEASGPDPKRRRYQMMDNPPIEMSSSPSQDHVHTNQPDTDTAYQPNTSGSSSYCLTSTPCSSPCSSSFSSPSPSTPPTPPLLPPAQRLRARGRALAAALVRAQQQQQQQQSSSPTSSIDEAFSDGSFESDAGEADFQQMVDGADALLNFAARATTMMPALLNGHITTYSSVGSETCGLNVESFSPVFQNAPTSFQSSEIDRGYKVYDAHNSHFGSSHFVHADVNVSKDDTLHGDGTVVHLSGHQERQEFPNGEGGLLLLNEARRLLTASNTVCGGTAAARRNIVTYPAARSGLLTSSTSRVGVIQPPDGPDGLGPNDQCLDRDDLEPQAKRIMLEPLCGFEEATDLSKKTVSSVSQKTSSNNFSVVAVSKSGFRAPPYSGDVGLATSADSFKYVVSKSSGTLQRIGGVDKGAKSAVENHSRKAKSMSIRTPGNMKHNNNNSLTSNNNISSLTKKMKRKRVGNPKLGLR